MNYIDMMKGLADGTRLRIMGLLALMNMELCVCQIIEALGESQYKISRHLRILKNAGWVKERRDGRWVSYSFMDLGHDPFGQKILASLKSLPAEFLDLKRSREAIRTFSKKNRCEV